MKTKTTPFSMCSEQVRPSFIRDILKAANQPNMISLAGGLPDPSLFPTQHLAKSAYRVLMNSGQEALQYTTTEGYNPLRRFIAERYHRQQGLAISSEQVLITSGSQQALDLIGKLFINPNDAIILERPSYLGAIQCFSQYGPRMLEIDLNKNGPNQEQLTHLLNSEQVKLFYTIPNFQNPTGNEHSLESRRATVDLLEKTSTFIIEDDPYGEIRFEGEALPTLHSMLPEQTILLGSFSKTVAPGLRIGWVIASSDIIKRLAVLKQASDLHSSHLDQQVLYDYLTHYNLDEHIASIIDLYKRRRDCMITAIEKEFSTNVHYSTPNGGMFLWLKFPSTIKAMEVLNRSIKEGIIFVPGETFYAEKAALNTARFNFSNTDETNIRYAIKKIGAIVRAMEMEERPKVKWWPLP